MADDAKGSDGLPVTPKGDKELLEEIRENLRKDIDENERERNKQRDDLKFCTLDQWDSQVRNARENDVNGARPCLTADKINQYIVQVANDIRQNRPSVKVRPADDQADIETAEVFQGVIRQIEDQSTAQIAYVTAVESAVRVGEGYLRILTEYEDERSFNQAIRIKHIPDMFNVYLGPHIMPTGEDAERATIFEDIPEQKFRRMYPKAKWTANDFDGIDKTYRGDWYTDKRIRVAEYFYFDYQEDQVVFLEDGKSMLMSEYNELEEKPVIKETRPTRVKKQKWCKVTGVEILEKRDWPGKWIPIIKVTGKETWIDGKRVIWGLVRPSKDALRMYNYVISAIVEKFMLAPKAPFVGAKGQFEGLEDRWKQANTANFAYLEYNPQSVDGSPVPPPQRQQPAQMEVAMFQFAQTCKEDVKEALAMYKASLGQEQPNQSGKAILALVRESDTGTFHFGDNLGLSIQHVGRQLVDLVPKYYDVPRVLKITGEDGKISTAPINPEMPTAVTRIADEQGKVQKIYNLNVGIYDVTVTVGPSYTTKRMEAATMFTDLKNSSKDPVTANIMGYLAVKNSDFNGAEAAARMLEKTLPPGIVEKEGEQNIPPEVQARMQQMMQLLQAASQKVSELESGEKAKQAKVAADHDAKMKQVELDRQEAAAKAALEKEVADAKAALDRAVAKEKADLARWEAEQAAQLERDKASAEFGIKKQQVDTDTAVKMDSLIPEEERKKFFEGKAIADAGKPLKEGMETTAQALQALMQRIEGSKPVSIKKVKDAQGNVTKAVATYANGDTREITIN